MSVAIVCASHTPLMYRGPASNETEQRVRTAFEGLGVFVKEFKPDYIIQFAPDHFNGFFYDLMPSFCVGAGAISLGDWGGGTGPLDVPEKTALALVDHVRAEDVDVAVSFRMRVDHGFVQMWEGVLGDFKSVPILPIFVNAAAPPVPTYRRARQLGESVGRFAMRSGKRVLFAASGGLSHDPPLPQLATADAQRREFLIAGRNPGPEARAARQKRILDAGQASARGEGPCQPLNPEWDRRVLKVLETGEIGEFDHWRDEDVRREGGSGGPEIRAWQAAFAALAAAGRYEAHVDYYRAIPEWIVGMAVMHAHLR